MIAGKPVEVNKDLQRIWRIEICFSFSMFFVRVDKKSKKTLEIKIVAVYTISKPSQPTEKDRHQNVIRENNQNIPS